MLIPICTFSLTFLGLSTDSKRSTLVPNDSVVSNAPKSRSLRNSPRHSPRRSPRVSSRLSSRHSPRLSPRHSPRQSPRALSSSPSHSLRKSPSPLDQRPRSSVHSSPHHSPNRNPHYSNVTPLGQSCKLSADSPFDDVFQQREEKFGFCYGSVKRSDDKISIAPDKRTIAPPGSDPKLESSWEDEANKKHRRRRTIRWGESHECPNGLMNELMATNCTLVSYLKVKTSSSSSFPQLLVQLRNGGRRAKKSSNWREEKK